MLKYKLKEEKMKRRWKDFKVNKNKLYMRIGQALVYGALYIASITFVYIMFLSGLTY